MRMKSPIIIAQNRTFEFPEYNTNDHENVEKKKIISRIEPVTPILIHLIARPVNL